MKIKTSSAPIAAQCPPRPAYIYIHIYIYIYVSNNRHAIYFKDTHTVRKVVCYDKVSLNFVFWFTLYIKEIAQYMLITEISSIVEWVKNL